MLSYHVDLVAKMQAVGMDSIDGGACFGVSAVGCQAILARDTDTYDRRIQLLASIPAAELNSRIASAYEEWKQEIASTKAEYKDPCFDQLPINVRRDILTVRFHRLESNTKLLLTIPAFLDSVRLYQKNNLPHLFPKYTHVTNQDILNVSPILTPKILEKRGGIAEVTRFCGAYSEDELGRHLRKLSDRLYFDQIKFPVVFMLRLINHAFVLGHDNINPYDKWTVIEAGTGPTQFASSDSIASGVMRCMSHDKYIVLETVTYTTADHYHQCLKAMNTFKNSRRFIETHQITKEKLGESGSLVSELFGISLAGGHRDILPSLITQFNINVNDLISNKFSPISITVSYNKPGCLSVLLNDPKIDVNLIDTSGFTPLGVAALFGYLDCLKLLLNKPATNINSGMNDGTSPLFLAAQNGKIECLHELLIQPGIDVNKANNEGGTALFMAAQNNHPECVAELVSIPSIDVNHKTVKAGETPLFIAAANGNDECVKKLLMHPDIDPTLTSNQGVDPLYIAVVNHRTECVRALANHPKINLDSTCPGDYYTSLMIAAKDGNIEIVKILIDAGACLDVKYRNFITALDMSGINNHHDICEILKKNLSTHSSLMRFTP